MSDDKERELMELRNIRRELWELNQKMEKDDQKKRQQEYTEVGCLEGLIYGTLALVVVFGGIYAIIKFIIWFFTRPVPSN